jgi:hypothetical protein
MKGRGGGRSKGGQKGSGRGGVGAKRKRESMGSTSEQHPAASSASTAAGSESSFLVSTLLGSWTWGFISLVFLQRICAASVRDWEAKGVAPPSQLKLMSELGMSGAHPANMHRDLLRSGIISDNMLGKAVQIPMPIRLAKNVWNMRMQAIIFPHLLFANMYAHYKEQFLLRVMPSEDAVESFWDAMTDHPLMDIVRQRVGGFRRNLVPIAMHGDDVPVTGVGKSWQKLITVFSWSVFLFVCQWGCLIGVA